MTNTEFVVKLAGGTSGFHVWKKIEGKRRLSLDNRDKLLPRKSLIKKLKRIALIPIPNM